MAVDILEAIKQQRLKAIRSSVAFSETRERIVHAQAESVKVLLSQDLQSPQEINPADLAASLYYKMVDEYHVRSSYKQVTTPTKRSIQLWTRVVKCADEVGLPIESYLRAQFAYFHRAFGRVPELSQLATAKAKDRAKLFVEGPKKIIGNDIRMDRNVAQLLRDAEEQMRQLCRQHNLSREDVYRKFVLTGLFFFPKEYLNADPVYKKVASE